MVDEALDDLNLGDLIATLGAIDDNEIDWQNVARTTVLIHQTFRYEYPGSITALRQRLMVVPPDYHDDQRLVTHKLRVSGSNVDTERSYDTFGNVVLDLTLQRVDREVEFTSWIVVEREAGADGAHYSEPLSPDARFSKPSRLTRPDDALEAVGAELRATGATGLELAKLVSARVHGSSSLRLGSDLDRDDGRRGMGRRRRRLPGLRPLHARARAALRPLRPLRLRTPARRRRQPCLGRDPRPASAAARMLRGCSVRSDARPACRAPVRHRRRGPRLRRRRPDLRHLRRRVRGPVDDEQAGRGHERRIPPAAPPPDRAPSPPL